LQSHGIASIARLQREEVSMIKEGIRRSSSNSTGLYEGLASSLEFLSFLLDANTMEIEEKEVYFRATY
jgi:hypothetical protein